MKLRLAELLASKKKTAWWLAQQTGITYPNIRNLLYKEPALIRFDTLEKLCTVLECTPNDILELETEVAKKDEN